MTQGKRSIRGVIVLQGINHEAKTCTLCGTLKQLDDYGVQRNTKDGRKSRCKPCLSAISRNYNQENPEKRRDSERSWRERNPDSVKVMAKRSRERHKDGYKRRLEEWKEKNPERYSAMRREHDHRRRALKRCLTTDEGYSSQFIRSLYDGCVLTDEKDDLHDDHFVALSTGHCGTYLENMVPMNSRLNISKGSKNPFKWIEEADSFIDYEKFAKSLLVLSYLNGLRVVDYIEFVNWCYENPRKPEDITDENRDSLLYWARIHNKRFIT
jgi:hypothetical protein